MERLKLIAAMGTGSCLHVHEGGGSRSPGQLTRSELAGLLAGLQPAAMNFALAKWAGDDRALGMLVAQVQVYAAGLAANEGWEVVRGRPTIMTMAKIAVLEQIKPYVHRECNGNGCEDCNGSGVKLLSGREVASLACIPKTTWFRVWQRRYSVLQAFVSDLEIAVQSCLGGD